MYDNLSDEKLAQAFELYHEIIKTVDVPVDDHTFDTWQSLRDEGKRRLAAHVERYRCDTFDKYKMKPEHLEFDTFDEAVNYACDKMVSVYGNRWDMDKNEKYGDAQFWWLDRWQRQDYVEMRVERINTPLHVFRDV